MFSHKKKFPKVIILVGFMGVGKTTLSFKLYDQLERYNFRFTTEYLYDNQIRDFKEIRNYTFSLYRDDLIRAKLIASFLKNSQRENENLLFDGFPLNSAFITSCSGHIEFYKNLKEVCRRIVAYLKKYEIEKEDLKRILVLNIKNDNDLKQYLNRKSKSLDSPEQYQILKENYNSFLDEIIKLLKDLGVHCNESNITNLDINSEDKIKKFIEENLLI
jgi:adenylate kinase family enzyme